MTQPLENGEFNELLAALDDGTLTPEQDERLMQLVAEDLQLRRAYLQHTFFVGQLRRLGKDPHEEVRQIVGEQPPTPRGVWRERLQKYPRRLSFLAAALVIGLLMFGMALIVPPVQRYFAQQREEAAPKPFVAKVVVLHEAVWRDANAGAEIGNFLTAGRTLDLKSGLAAIAFNGGAEVILKGPALLRVDTAAQCHLRQGKLVARSENTATPFVVETPLANVTDLGTEFIVSVAEEAAIDVFVMEGVVEVAPRNRPDPPKRLLASEGIHLANRGGKWQWNPHWDEASARSATESRNLIAGPIVSRASWGPIGNFAASTTDLANANSSALQRMEVVAGAAAFDSSLAKLNDGDLYGGVSHGWTKFTFTPRDTSVVEVHFDISSSPAGYDIQSIETLSGTDQARASQRYRVEARKVGEGFKPLYHINETLNQNYNREKAGEVSVKTLRRRGMLAIGIDALRFTFEPSPQNAAGGETMYRELDIFGQPAKVFANPKDPS